MKATGIVRKIDDLGRIVIPKEIRKGLRIRVGDPLEIYVEKNGEIILKKYAPMGDLLKISEQYADTLFATSGFSVCITDTDTIIAVSGCAKKDYLDKEINENILKIMEERTTWSTKDDSSIKILKSETTPKYGSQAIAPIVSDGDIIGSVILFSLDYAKKITEVELKLINSAAIFLGKQMEQ
ncbi:MAG: stage sporulation protein [Clostridia bacterium]|jgi:AbrB family transcriptional regulator (stage V sporulation protein T)|nr:stage sporulation protein [Clostridia bacterium]